MSDADQRFEGEVKDFLHQHAPPVDAAHDVWRHTACCEGLLARGWSVPGWPVQYGGTGWSATAKHIWYRLCRLHIPDYQEPPGIAQVGPLLMRLNASHQRDAHLRGIRELRDRWCVGYAEARAGLDWTALQGVARWTGADWRVQADKVWVEQAADARWMCAFVRAAGHPDGAGFGFVLVDLSAAGVQIHPQVDWSGGQASRVVLEQVTVPPNAMLGPFADGAACAAYLDMHVSGVAGVTGALRAQLDTLALQSVRDPSLDARRVEAEVELAALEAMELRWVDALARSVEPPFPPAALRLRADALAHELGECLIASFGYYALPYPDELVTHNEGPVGPSGATVSMRRLLRQQARAQYASLAGDVYDVLSEHLEERHQKG